MASGPYLTTIADEKVLDDFWGRWIDQDMPLNILIQQAFAFPRQCCILPKEEVLRSQKVHAQC